MVRNRKRPDARPPRSKGVAGIGPTIGRQSTMGRIIKASGKTDIESKKKQRVLPTVADVPAEIRTKVVDIRRRYRGWGPQGNNLAARGIIAACDENKATVNLVMATILRKPIHKKLRDAIRKQLQARQEKQNK